MTHYSLSSQVDSILRSTPVIPVLTIRRIEQAVPLADALVKGGLVVLEVTLRSSIATQAIQRIREALPQAVVGAGSILDAEALRDASEAGAVFGVSPGLGTELAEAVALSDLPLLPGVATASEIMTARALGFRHLKFFPAEAIGGQAALSGFAGPFRDVFFCPTGGIREENMDGYLALRNVLCVGGSWMVPDEEINQGAWSAITERALRVSRSPDRPSGTRE